jgi:hypothetical protein
MGLWSDCGDIWMCVLAFKSSLLLREVGGPALGAIMTRVIDIVTDVLILAAVPGYVVAGVFTAGYSGDALAGVAWPLFWACEAIECLLTPVYEWGVRSGGAKS